MFRMHSVLMHRVLVVANDPLSRAGLATLLDEEPIIDVVGRSTVIDAVGRDIDSLKPDVVVFDSGWDSEAVPNAVVDAIGEIQAFRLPLVVLLAHEAHASEVYLANVYPEGGRALLLRDASAGELAIAVTAAVQGLTVLAPALADAIASPSHTAPELAQGVLTRRELEVLRLVAEGHS